MKSLFLTQDFPPDSGGIARLYGELCARFPEGGVEVAAPRTTNGADAGAAEAYIRRMPFTFREARRITTVAWWTRWTRARLARGDVTLLQVGNIRPAGYVAAWLRPRTGIPYVIYVHGKDVWKEEQKAARSARARWTARRILGRASAIIANSRATAERTERLLKSLGIDPAGRVRVVHPATDPGRFRPGAPGADAWRGRLGLEGRTVVLSVSRLMARKGIDTALHAIARLVPRHPDLVYVVGGDGPERERLERLADELGIAPHVRFLGPVDDAELPGLYAAADIFVLPVREEPDDAEVEGFGIVFCEAAATALPVIAGDSGGVADAVRGGESAFLVPPADPDAVAERLGQLLADPALRRRMGEAGRRAVEEYYHWDRAAAEVWRILEEVSGASREGAR